MEDFELNRMLRKQARVLREEEKEYFDEKRAKNLSIPLLPACIEDELMANQVEFKQEKTRHIKKEDKPITEREKLKDKMRKMNPSFRNKLRQEIKLMNRPTSSVFIKK
jgi:hypothetical protein